MRNGYFWLDNLVLNNVVLLQEITCMVCLKLVRRKTEQTWTIVSQTIDDNHGWRKYGQKDILNSQFPR